MPSKKAALLSAIALFTYPATAFAQDVTGGSAATTDNAPAAAGDGGLQDIVVTAQFLINTGGVNVFPAQVEAVLANEQSISDVMVVGVPHPEWGEAVVAAVVAREGATDVRERVLDHCRRHLSKLEAPKHVELMEVLPRTTNGKPDKKALIAHFNDKVALPWNAPRQAMGG